MEVLLPAIQPGQIGPRVASSCDPVAMGKVAVKCPKSKLHLADSKGN